MFTRGFSTSLHDGAVIHLAFQVLAALLEASPAYLARRMKMLESRLTAARKMALTTSPAPCAKRWKAAAGVADCRLWSLPYETLERRGRLPGLRRLWPTVGLYAVLLVLAVQGLQEWMQALP